MSPQVYCPHCRSQSPLSKDGLHRGHQRWCCPHCHRTTTIPKKAITKKSVKKSRGR